MPTGLNLPEERRGFSRSGTVPGGMSSWSSSCLQTVELELRFEFLAYPLKRRVEFHARRIRRSSGFSKPRGTPPGAVRMSTTRTAPTGSRCSTRATPGFRR
ncbi:MAG: hypothetical protein L6W00_19865 [Lentisphaeria bacterium]|nr:MAG: hypothetical protein L6W00_19865 [Lentisphaeria bacterium]